MPQPRGEPSLEVWAGRRSFGARLLAIGLASGNLFALGGCGRPQGGEAFRSVDVTGADYAKDITGLADLDGRPRSLADFRGKAVQVFFGFTHCPDVCPTTLQEAADAVRLLGSLAERYQVLFITLDPARDTPESMRRYVQAFDPSIVALRADEATTSAVAKRFKIFFQKVPGRTPDSYTLDHTAASYLYDPQGRVRLFVRHGLGAEALAHDIRLLLAQ